MPDFSSKQLQKSLAEVFAWCMMRGVEMNANSGDIRERQALYAQAEQQWEEAQQSANRSWLHRKITDTEQWQKATALLNQIRDSLGPMHHKLRSAELKPDIDLDGLRSDEDWGKAVAIVIGKRSR